MTATDPHPRWPDGLRVHVGEVGLVQITGATEYHSDYSPCWWVGAVTGIDWGIVRFGCGEQLESELIGQVYGLTQARLDGADVAEWDTATAAVDGLRALGCAPPRALIEQALAECGLAVEVRS